MVYDTEMPVGTGDTLQDRFYTYESVQFAEKNVCEPKKIGL